MKRNPMTDVRRRTLLKAGALGVAACALYASTGRAMSQARKPHLDESDPEAEKLGYKHDAAKVDKKRFPTYRPGETCANCQLFQRKAESEEWAPCPIFPGKLVHAEGWCSSYTKKISS